MNLDEDLKGSADPTLDLIRNWDLRLELPLLVAIEDFHGEDIGVS